MAFITNGITNWIGGYVDQVVGGALKAGGGFAGDAVGAVGNGINSFGGGVEKSIRRYGDGAKDYGNAIKDWTDADGPRNTTASNPLGLPTSMTGGKHSLGSSGGRYASIVNSSPAYRAPSAVGTKAAVKANPTPKTLPSNKRVIGAVAGKKPAVKKVPIAGTPVKKTAVTGTKSSAAKPASGGVKKVPIAGTKVTRDQALGKKK